MILQDYVIKSQEKQKQYVKNKNQHIHSFTKFNNCIHQDQLFYMTCYHQG